MSATTYRYDGQGGDAMVGQVSGGLMAFGVVLIILGIGSILLKQYTDRQFILLSWAESYQPWAGVGVALLG
ncbi:MAG TPA: hypothetical protein VGR21_06920, partial [Cryptosporangiaceae bacterium]|nr:hypothetical protein [Cryptosporangiaceae bacterium]